MSNVVLSLVLAAGASGFAYSKLGRRVGYGNSQNIWLIVGVAFILVFLFFLILLHFIIHLGQ